MRQRRGLKLCWLVHEYHLMSEKLGNVTIADIRPYIHLSSIHPSGILGAAAAACCPPRRLNNPTLDPSPDPAALIGLGFRGSRLLIGGAAEQQAAEWTVHPSTRRGHMEQ